VSEDPRARLDPKVKALFELLAPGRSTRVLEAGALRDGIEALVPLLVAGAPEVAREEEIAIPGPGGACRALVFHPPRAEDADAPPPILLYAHGGGFVFMSPESHARLAKQLCVEADAVVVSLDYRLAPEHRHPAALDDCLAALRWLREHGATLGADPARIAMGGDSAGGNLTAATTLRLVANREEPPRAALLLCPVLDMHFDTPSFHRLAPDDPVLDTDIMRFFRTSYVSREEWDDPFVSPLRAELAGFPPTLVVAAGLDPLHDDATRFAERLRAAGREARMLDVPGMPHIFMAFPGLDDGPQSIPQMGAFLREHLAP
jgi:acetyl esterase